VLREFRRLDLAGEGRLTYLSVKSALDLEGLGDQVADSDIRQWLRQHDQGNKGYVDLNDFQKIYTVQNDTLMSSTLNTRHGDGWDSAYEGYEENAMGTLSSVSDRQKGDRHRNTEREGDRLELLKL